MSPPAYLIEPEEVAKLRAIADRLGDCQTLTHDQRRDLMNQLALIVSGLVPYDYPDPAL
jgi:hypothetical protein